MAMLNNHRVYIRCFWVSYKALCHKLLWSGAEMCQQRSSQSFCWKSCRVRDMEVCQRSETQSKK